MKHPLTRDKQTRAFSTGIGSLVPYSNLHNLVNLLFSKVETIHGKCTGKGHRLRSKWSSTADVSVYCRSLRKNISNKNIMLVGCIGFYGERLFLGHATPIKVLRKCIPYLGKHHTMNI